MWWVGSQADKLSNSFEFTAWMYELFWKFMCASGGEFWVFLEKGYVKIEVHTNFRETCLSLAQGQEIVELGSWLG